jgi:death on curing protein
MIDFRWVPEAAVKAIQAELIVEHGGAPGVLNAGQLSATLARPQNLLAYGDSPTLFDLAASYGYGLIKNHCFLDGNKRVAVAVVDVFLQLNGYELIAEEADVVFYFLRLAASLDSSEKDEMELAGWIEENSVKI